MRTMFRSAVGLISVTLCLGLTGFAQQTVNVSMTQSARFEPADVFINPGDTVLWTNTSTSLPHTVTGEEPHRPEGFNSGSFPLRWLRPGETFEFTFTSTGVFSYHCIPHNNFGMRGTVTVRGTSVAPEHLFTAAPLVDENQVLVQWNAPRDKDRVGFNVLRSSNWDQEFVRVNDATIIATPGVHGDQFRFVDENIKENTQYYYIVEEVRVDGKAAFRGPAVANAR